MGRGDILAPETGRRPSAKARALESVFCFPVAICEELGNFENSNTTNICVELGAWKLCFCGVAIQSWVLFGGVSISFFFCLV